MTSRLFGLGWTLVVFNGEPRQTLQTADEAVAAWQEARRESKLAGAAKHGGQATKEKFEELQSFDRAAWRQEVLGHEELFLDLHDRLPPEMVYERELLICRL